MAVEQSTIQMALTRDTGAGGFMERVTAMMAMTATTVLGEPFETPYHAGRASYSQRVVQNPSGMAAQGAPQVVMGSAVVATTTYDATKKTSTCSITDVDLQTEILTMWNALAGLDTPADAPPPTRMAEFAPPLVPPPSA